MIPLERVYTMIELLLRPAATATRAARHILLLLARGVAPSTITSANIASCIGVHQRTLQREFRDLGLVTPKQYTRWLTLLLIAKSAECGGMSTACVPLHSS
jgi:AraC-like DNA-binding protein